MPYRKGKDVGIPGFLTVEQGNYPNGILQGDMSIEWVSEGAEGIVSFPQRQAKGVLRGRLSNGAYVSLMNGELRYSLSGRGWAVGALAAPSLDEFDISEHSK